MHFFAYFELAVSLKCKFQFLKNTRFTNHSLHYAIFEAEKDLFYLFLINPFLNMWKNMNFLRRFMQTL